MFSACRPPLRGAIKGSMKAIPASKSARAKRGTAPLCVSAKGTTTLSEIVKNHGLSQGDEFLVTLNSVIDGGERSRSQGATREDWEAAIKAVLGDATRTRAILDRIDAMVLAKPKVSYKVTTIQATLTI